MDSNNLPRNADREYLKFLSTRLLKLHKALMDHHMKRKEKVHGTLFNPNQKLQLLLNDPDFEWLRTLSRLMAIIDDAYFQKETLAAGLIENLKEKTHHLFLKEGDPQFTSVLLSTLKESPKSLLEHEKTIHFLKTLESPDNPKH